MEWILWNGKRNVTGYPPLLKLRRTKQVQGYEFKDKFKYTYYEKIHL
jgi:hypothetical protein